MSLAYRRGPTAAVGRAPWSPAPPAPPPASPPAPPAAPARPLSGHFDRIFNAFERSDAFELVSSTAAGERRSAGRGARRLSSSFERADSRLAASSPGAAEDEVRARALGSQARQLFPLQEDLADWINKTVGVSYVSGDNFFDVLDNGVVLCALAAAVQERARLALDQGLIVGPVPSVRGRCWRRAARRSFFSRDNAENFITFCREFGVHDNLLFESDDLVLQREPRQVLLALLELARLAARAGLEPPGLVALEHEIDLEEAADPALWQFRDHDTRSIAEASLAASKENRASADPGDAGDAGDAASTRSGGSDDSDVPLRPNNELDKRVQLATRLLERGCSCGARCSKLLKVKKVGEGRYNIAGRNVFIRLLKGRHMMVRVGGGWDTLEHFLSRHEPCQCARPAPAARRRRYTYYRQLFAPVTYDLPRPLCVSLV